MAHSLELLVDDALDGIIRAQWRTLAEAGLPSRANVAAPTNRPHVTLVAAPSISSSVDAALVPLAMRLPVPVRLGGLVVFGGHNRFVLARLVVASSELLSIHAATLRLAAVDDPFAHGLPGEWTPHITLARRMTAEQVGTALALLPSAEPHGSASAIRRWDGDAHTEHVLPGRDC
ncbi:2'-5' RNA ligase [Gordonia amarae]|uniref:2'-5' RNA ligase n=1 Tax=Gordonia amarae NBRC 15530 TaxID=1075090 RepID=G7GM01_9ACTN|nr:2'-5' RNA ligase family protein [Gordonia amarae]MCS3876443.1 2'-5' RNA ligase [Gordonia amarae]QHN19356.1 2'-5' RNA ligase family protein [Gordonia amarae]QHN23832.1 2'-5' RNA ligase family protein [Gordonia amarae]QHN32742.1 2'-5' RNA ligase family protein [Gordonia amarae]GAB04626.1 hypothetical protein GOAMR_20_01740 [Gordonia amarae NBRC 15530]